MIGPQMNVRTILDKEFSKKFGSIVQLKPQKHRLSLRNNSSWRIPIHFRQADDYPMDLMDIRSSVELRVERMSDFIEIDLHSKCETETEMKTNKCTFKGRPDITFFADIRVKSCPADRSLWEQKIKIGISLRVQF